MEAPEVPLEQVQEDIHHHSTSHHHAPDAWTRWIALSTAMIAALAALAALLAGHTETEAMTAKMECNDQWNFYQAKSIKQNLVEGQISTLHAFGKDPEPDLKAKVDKYDQEKAEISKLAKRYDGESKAYLEAHTKYGYGVTMFQIAIALAAISALTRRRRYWLISLGLGAIGVGCAGYGGVIQSGIHEPAESHESAPAHAAESHGAG
jgi:hypothetical protein